MTGRMRPRRWGLALAALALWGAAGTARGSIFNVAGFTFDDANSVRRIQAFSLNDPLLPPVASTIPTSPPNGLQPVNFAAGEFPGVNAISPPGAVFPTSSTISQRYFAEDPANRFGPPAGSPLIALGSSTSNTLVPSGVRGLLELDFGPFGQVSDLAGADLFIYENGPFQLPETYAVSVRTVGGAFTPFLYKAAMTTQPVNSALTSNTFGTAFDLREDFGLTPGSVIDAVRITNVIPSLDTIDRFSALTTVESNGLASRGVVLRNNAFGYALDPGLVSGLTSLTAAEGSPEIAGVFASNLTVVPEPASCALVALGLLGAWRLRRRRDG